MREIKFRVWNHTEGHWNGMRCKDVQSCGYLICLNGIYVIPESVSRNHTVQQFTGLLDKNGVEIYEGDVIKYHRVFESKREVIELTSCIKFQNGEFGFDMKGFNDMFMSLGDDSDIEVIGNIFENNELLEK